MLSQWAKQVVQTLRVSCVAGMLLCLEGTGYATPPAPKPPDSHGQALALYEEAQVLYRHGAYRAAIVRLKEAVALDPDGKELHYNLGLIYEKLGDLDAAETHYQRYHEMETSPQERKKVEAVLERLRGARKEFPKPSNPSTDTRSTGSRPWLYATASLAVGAFAFGTAFAVAAVVRNPGSQARTDARTSVDDLHADARAAYHYAIVADVAWLVAAAAGGATIALYAATPSTKATTSVPQNMSLVVGGSGATLRVLF